MKRVTAFLVGLLIIFSTNISIADQPLINSNATPFESADNGHSLTLVADMAKLGARSYWIEDTGIYYLSSKNEMRFVDSADGSDTLLRRIVLDDKYDNLTAYNEGICCIGSSSDDILVISRDSEELIQIDVSTFLHTNMDDFSIRDFRKNETHVFFVITEPDESTNGLLVISLLDSKSYYEQIPNFDNIELYGDDQLLLSSNGKVRIYDTSAREFMAEVTAARIFDYSPLSHELLFVSGGNIFCVQDDAKPELIFIAPYIQKDDDGTFAKLPIHEITATPAEKLYIRSNGKIYLADTHPVDTTLKVYWDDYRYETTELMEAYKAENPHVQFEYVHSFADRVPDIYNVANEGIGDLSSVRRNGGLLSLRNSELICSDHAQYFPQARQTLSYQDNSPFATPVSLMLSPWFYNERIWEDIGLGELPSTLDDFFRMIILWNDVYAAQYPQIIFFGESGLNDMKTSLAFILKNIYINENATGSNPLSFDTMAFKDLIKKIASLPSGMPVTVLDDDATLIRSHNGIYQIWGTYTELLNGEVIGKEYKAFLPPASSSDVNAKIGARIEALGIPVDAENPELALDYLEFCTLNRSIQQADIDYMLTLQNPKLQDIQAVNDAEYRSLIPHITFDINALGGRWSDSDIATEFLLLSDSVADNRKIDLDEKLNKLIHNLNSFVKRYYEISIDQFKGE